ncbi:MAG TPA: FliA/WhiG family RNA polymerase sigma factor, partial [Actinomycetota bacterium]
MATAKKPAATKTATKTAPKPATKAKPKAKAGATSAAATATITIPPHVDDELGGHWHEWKTTGAVEPREKLILHYAPLVKYVASRVATGLPASVEQADLVSYGMFGLIDALTKFEPGRGNKFETYAIPRIKGAIIDELRAMDWVPRSIRFKAREIDKANTDLEAMLKRQPSESELAERLGISLRELHDVVSQISFVSVLALDEMVSVGADRGEQVSLIDTLADRGIDPTQGVESQETRGLLAAAINELSEREKIVVTLYYFEGLT